MLLEQSVHAPLPVAEEVVLIFGGVRGFLDKMSVEEVNPFEDAVVERVRAKHPEFLAEINEKKVISEDLDKRLTDFYTSFTEEFLDKDRVA